MKRFGSRGLFVLLVLTAVGLLFVAFDAYVDRVADEVMNAIVRSEAAAIQQGNLLNSITKLQSAVVTSGSLRAVAVYDRSLDPSLKFPLISLGQMPSFADWNLNRPVIRTGVLQKIFFRSLPDNKVLVFYFHPQFVLWSYVAFSVILVIFAFVVAGLGRRIEYVRAKERADVLFSVWQQISHDIRSPLGALNIFASHLERKGVSADLLKSSAQRIEGILDDLKVRSENWNNLYVTDESFEVASAVRGVINEKSLEYSGHRIDFHLGNAGRVKGSESQFKRVVSNLLNNAIEASACDKPIVVRLEHAGGKQLLSILDQGHGIPENQMHKIFSKGFTSGKANGSGLGLFHARNVIAAMGGELTLRSTPSVGTEASIRLPQ